RLFLLLLPPPLSTLFPYTTLFRSRRGRAPVICRGADLVAPRRSARTGGPLRLGGRRALVRSRLGGNGVGRCARLGRTRVSSLVRSEEHTSELQSLAYIVCRLLLEK